MKRRSCLSLVVCAAWSAALPVSCQHPDGPDAAGSTKPETAAASSSPPSVLGVPTQEPLSVGETAKTPDYEMKLRAVRECEVAPPYRPPVGHVKLGVEVWLHAISDREVPVNPFSATVTDSGGNSYNIAFGGCAPVLASVRLREGDQTEGWISFEIPERARGLTLEFRPFVLRTGNEPVRFDLGR